LPSSTIQSTNTADGSITSNLELKKPGPIHDVSWSPSGREFAVIYGSMPNPSTTIFDSKSNTSLDLGTTSRNTLRWSPNGKLLCVGGFGNLAGQMDFWDVKNAKKVGSSTAHCASICEWAPDSRQFIAATVSPRIRVDNGYKIFKYDGTLLHEVKIQDELYQVFWRPRPANFYPDRPLTPPPKGGAGPSVASSSSSSQPQTTPAPAKYRHPHAAESTQSSAPKEDEGVKRYKPPAKTVDRNTPPGWFEDEDKKKKKKKKKKAPGEKEDGDNKETEKGKETLGVETLSISSPSDSNSNSQSPPPQQQKIINKHLILQELAVKQSNKSK